MVAMSHSTAIAAITTVSPAPLAAIYHGMTVDAVSDLDLSYTPPLGSPWDAVQMAAQTWVRQTRPR